jgi:hypothetical protein
MRAISWHSSENFDTLVDIMAHEANMVNFGTDAAERWVG